MHIFKSQQNETNFGILMSNQLCIEAMGEEEAFREPVDSNILFIPELAYFKSFCITSTLGISLDF